MNLNNKYIFALILLLIFTATPAHGMMRWIFGNTEDHAEQATRGALNGLIGSENGKVDPEKLADKVATAFAQALSKNFEGFAEKALEGGAQAFF